MKNPLLVQFQKAAFSTGCGWFAVTMLTQHIDAIHQGLGSIYSLVVQGEWVIVIACFGCSGLFGLKLSGDVRTIVKKRMEGIEDFDDEKEQTVEVSKRKPRRLVKPVKEEGHIGLTEGLEDDSDHPGRIDHLDSDEHSL